MRDNLALTRVLLAARLRWYAVCTGRLVTRNWQWFLLALAVVPLPQVLTIVGYPFITLFDPMLTVQARLSVLALLSLLIVLWVHPQRQQIIGSKFELFLNTVPIAQAQRIIVDIATLSVAISLVLVPAFVTLLIAEDLTPKSPGWYWLAMPAVVGVLLIVGYSVLHRRRNLFVATLVLNAVLAFGLGMPDVTSLLMLLALAAVCTIANFSVSGKRPESPTGIGSRHSSNTRTVRLKANRWAGVALPWRIARENILSVTLRFVGAGALTIFAVTIQGTFNFDYRALFVGVLAVAINAFMLGGIGRYFQEARVASCSYISTLPKRQCSWIILELTCLCLLAAPFSAVIVVYLVGNGVMSEASALFLSVAQLPLIVSLHQIVTRTGRHGVLVGSLLVVCWVWAVLVIAG